ncbi:unnamed protein product [Diatraea saccharalis]|uniref:Metalloendopeptidase n=1 Tax=Diatraea saccharalis TaxID=40085 RepID=A0A9N9QTY8_9NEOP|nr:unnamed protein product [Diatraea saccharalis]
MFRFVVLSCLLAVAAAVPPVAKSRADIENYKVALEKSREDDGLTLEERMAENPGMNAWSSSGKYQGDIYLDDDLIEEMVDDFSLGRMAYTRANTRWPSAVAVYEFGPGEFNLDQQRFILNVMNGLSERTCVRFRVRNANDRNFVRITGRPTGCYASVGYNANRGIHTLNVARNTPGFGCLNFVVISHEWYHALGFWHMQSTYNRDNYVRIHWENIQQGMAHNFDKVDSRFVSNLGLPYEYGSSMHYGTHFFSSNGRPTLSTTRPYNGVLGQTSVITGFDLWRLARHYNCPGAWSAEVMEKARTTVYVPTEEGNLTEETVDTPLADELELLEDVEIAKE